MRLWAPLARLLGAVNTASPAVVAVETRLAALEQGHKKLVDDWEYVLDRINRWSARAAAQKRHQAVENLDKAIDPTESPNVDPGASSAEPDREEQLYSERQRLKAAIRRKMMGG